MTLADWTSKLRSTIGLEPEAKPAAVERRREARHPSNRKVILRQRKALGILHLRNLSSNGGCGLTDMPVAVGSLIFVELRKPHFFAAEVRWVRNLSIGLKFFRQLRAEMFEAPAEAAAPPKGRKQS